MFFTTNITATRQATGRGDKLLVKKACILCSSATGGLGAAATELLEMIDVRQSRGTSGFRVAGCVQRLGFPLPPSTTPREAMYFARHRTIHFVDAMVLNPRFCGNDGCYPVYDIAISNTVAHIFVRLFASPGR